jgi:hypothetical protein
MSERQIRRITRKLTDAEKVRPTRQREQITSELPDLQARNQKRKAARSEATLSGGAEEGRQ